MDYATNLTVMNSAGHVYIIVFKDDQHEMAMDKVGEWLENEIIDTNSAAFIANAIMQHYHEISKAAVSNRISKYLD